MKNFVLIAMLLCSVIAYGQSNVAEAESNTESISGGNSMFRSFDSRDKKLRGTLNIFEDYLPGVIELTDGKEIEFDRMNYDGYYDALIISRKRQEQVVTTMMVEGFYVIDDPDTLFFDRMLRPDDKMGFYQRLSLNEHISLYKKHVRSLEQPTYNGAYSTGKQYAELVPVSKYFVRDGTFRPREFKNKKTFLELFPNEEVQLNKFIKEKKIDFKKEQDLISLVTYLDKVRATAAAN
jgi:hypothetical protein